MIRVLYPVPPEIRAWAADVRRDANARARKIYPGDSPELRDRRDNIAAAYIDGALTSLEICDAVLVPASAGAAR